MKFAKRTALLMATAFIAVAASAPAASAGLVEGPIEGSQLTDYLQGPGYPMGCGSVDSSSFEGEIEDGSSNPATGAIYSWDDTECQVSAGTYYCEISENSLPWQFEIYDDGAIKVYGVERYCANSGGTLSLTAPVVEGVWHCDDPAIQFTNQWFVQGVVIWNAEWELYGLEPTGTTCQ